MIRHDPASSPLQGLQTQKRLARFAFTKPLPLMKRIPFLYRLVRGAIGKRFVVKHYRGGQVVVTRYPDMRGIVPSEEQKRRRRLFTRAVRYARKVYATPALKEERRRLLRRPRRLFQALVKEWFRTQKEKDYRRQQRLQRWQMAWQHHRPTTLMAHPLPAVCRALCAVTLSLPKGCAAGVTLSPPSIPGRAPC